MKPFSPFHIRFVPSVHIETTVHSEPAQFRSVQSDKSPVLIEASDWVAKLSAPLENELVVVLPLGLLRVQTRLDLPGTVGTCAAGAHHKEALLLQRIEGLLQEGVFEEEAARVAVRLPAIRVSALVQRVLEHLPTQRHSPAHDDTAQFPELDVSETVSAEGEGSAIPYCDVARSLAGDWR